MKSLAPCTHFAEKETCERGFVPGAHCAICQLYWSDWDAERELLIQWLGLFGVKAYSALPPQSIPFERRRLE